MQVLGIVLLCVAIINLVATIIMVFWERNSPQSTLLWMFAFTLFPIIGFILYLFWGNGARFGRHKQYLKKAYDDQLYENEFKNQVRLIQKLEGSGISAQLAKFNLNQSKAVCTFSNNAKLYRDTKEMFNDLFADIEGAKESVNLEYFIIRNDRLGKQLINQLVKKVKEGVSVKLVYDDVGSFKTPKKLFKPLIKAGGEVACFFASNIRALNINMNYRNHRKIVVIDNKIGYTGGSNVGVEYVNEHKRITPWRDTNVRVVGDMATMLNLRFISDFSFAAKKDYIIFPKINKEELAKKRREAYVTIKKEFASTGNTQIPSSLMPMQLVVSGPDTPNDEIKTSYIKAISLAKKRVLLQTPYFIPDKSFIEALINAKLSGAEVELIIPKVPDKKYVYYATISYAKQLLKYGIKVYLYHGFIHSKTLVIDDEISSVGTFNLDMRSFTLHFENTLYIYSKEFCSQMASDFELDKKESTVLTEEYVKKRPRLERFLEKIWRLVTPLL